MEKKLILEINRINELIRPNSTGKIISESNIIGKVLQNGLEYFSKNINKIANTDEFMVGSIKIRKLMFDRLDAFLRGTISNINLLTPKESYVLGQILSQDTELANNIYKEVIEDFIKKNRGATERELLDMIDYELRTSGDPRKTLKTIFSNSSSPNLSELQAGLLENVIKKRIRLAPKEEISATREFFQGLGMSVIEYLRKIPVIKGKLTKAYFKQLQPLDNLEKQFLEVSSKIQSKLSRGGTFEISEEIKEMNNILSQFSIQIDKQQGFVWNEWKTLAGPEFEKMMPGIEDPKFKEFYNYLEKSINTKKPPTLVFTKMDAAKKIFSWGKNGFLGNLDVFRRRVGNSLIALDPRLVSEIRQNLEKYGTSRGLGKEVGDKILASIIFWPSIIAAVQTILDYIEYAINDMAKISANIPGGDAEFVRNNKPLIDNLIADNILNFTGNLFKHWFENMGIGAKDLTKLFGWSPALWMVGQQFWGDSKDKKPIKQIKVDVKKANQDTAKVKAENKNSEVEKIVSRIDTNTQQTNQPDTSTTYNIPWNN